jgi:hypothetical protein
VGASSWLWYRVGDLESTWVTIPNSFLITLIDCVYDYFSASYCCLEYLAVELLCAQQMSLVML